MNNKPKILFFFTSSFPFGKGETFIENEINFLSKAFDKIIIVSNDTKSKQTREVPNNAIIKRIPYELDFFNKLLSLLNVFNPLFWQEIKIIKTRYKQKITLPIINTISQTIQKSKLLKHKIDKLIKQYSYSNDSIYLYSYWNNDTAFAIAKYKNKHRNIVAFSRMHGWDAYFEVNAIKYLPLRRYIFENLDRVFAISERGKDYYNTLLPEVSNKIAVSRLGVFHYGYNPVKSNERLNILTISNLVPVKNLHVLIKALALVDIPFKWTHIGDGILKKELEKLAGNLIPEKYIFKGYMPNKAVINYLLNNQVDIFINVSLSEGIPVSIMEAFSFGIPAIAPNVGGIPEIVKHTYNGILLSNPTDPIEVKKTIEEFYKLSNDKKIEMRENAFYSWGKSFNAEKNYKEFIYEIKRM